MEQIHGQTSDTLITRLVSKLVVFSLGDDTDTAVNTAGCRQHYAALATTNQATNCAAAAAHGGNVCGTYCESWCFFIQNTCSEEFLLLDPTFDTGACQALCVTIQVSSQAFPLIANADSVQCRNYHGAASWVNTTIHCPHTSMAGALQCGTTPLQDYCNLMNFTCPLTYNTVSNCTTQAAGIDTSQIATQYGLVSGDNLGCRFHQARIAYRNASYCANAAVNSPVCKVGYVFPTPAVPTFHVNPPSSSSINLVFATLVLFSVAFLSLIL